jgi:hypothetical protein
VHQDHGRSDYDVYGDNFDGHEAEGYDEGDREIGSASDRTVQHSEMSSARTGLFSTSDNFTGSVASTTRPNMTSGVGNATANNDNKDETPEKVDDSDAANRYTSI